MEKARNSKYFKNFILVALIILPIFTLVHYILLDFKINLDLLNPYYWLWLGFYSTILLLVSTRKSGDKIGWKWVFIVLNSLVILFYLLVSAMGGIQGLISIFLKIILPFIPYEWIFKLVYRIMPAMALVA